MEDRQLTEQEHSLRLLDAVKDGVNVVNDAYELVYVNPVLEDIFGPWMGKKCYEYFGLGSHRCANCTGPVVFLEGGTVRKEWLCRINGRTYDLVDTPLRRPDGSVWKLEILRDITELKHIEDALRWGENQYRSTIDSMTDALHVTGPDLTILLMNRAFLEWHRRLGLDTDVVGKNIFELYPFLPDKVRDEYLRVFETGETITTEEATLLDGIEVITETRKVPVVKDGEVIKVITLIRDITKSKGAEEALRTSEREKALILDSASELISFQDPDLRVIWANKAAADSIGVKPEDLVGRHCYEIWQLRKQPCEACPMVEAMETGSTCEREMSTLEGRVWLVRANPVIDERGDTVGAVEVTLDITKRKHSERVLRRERKAFHTIAQAAVLAENIGDVCRRVLTGLTDALDFDFGTLHLYDKSASMLSLVACTGLDERSLGTGARRHAVDDCTYVASQVARTRIAIFAPDVSEHDVGKTHSARLRETGTKALISWPIVSAGGELLGVMDLGSFEPRVMDEEDRSFFETVAGMFAVALERKISEEALRESEELYRCRFEDSPLALWEEDCSLLKDHLDRLRASGIEDFDVYFHDHPEEIDACAHMIRLRDANSSALQLYQVKSLEEFVRHTSDNLLERTRDVFREILNGIVGGVAGFDIEYTTYTAGGEERFVKLRWAAAPGSETTLARILVSAVDITERRRAEEALKESEERFRSLADRAPNMIFIKTRERIVYVNRMCEEVMGYTKDELCSPDFEFLELVAPEQRELVGSNYAEHMRGAEVSAYEYRVLTRAGERLDVILSSKLIEFGGERAILGVVTDITGRKQAERQVQRYSKDLEQMVEERTERIRELERQRAEGEKLAATGRMAARIAHEINNPLGGIKNSFLLVKDAIHTDHPHYKYVSRIEREIDRIARIVRRVFDLYTPDRTGRVQVSVDEAIQDVASLMQSTSRAAQVELKVTLPDGPIAAVLPPGCINEVLFNLIQNAVEASEPGDLVEVTATVNHGMVSILVSDRGRGISQDIAGQVFEPFFTTKVSGETGGLGLGLSVTKGMVEAIGGTVTFESEPGVGTTFKVTLPLVAPLKEA